MDEAGDHLLGVTDSAAARAALDASEHVVLPDGRATAWLAADRFLTGAWYVAFWVTLLAQDLGVGAFPSMALKLVVATGALVLLLGVACDRMVGLRPSQVRVSRWSRFADVAVVALAFLVVVSLEPDVVQVGEVMGVGVLFYGATPVVRWLRASRRGPRGSGAWPSGAQAFAILTILARVEGITPDRLFGIAGLDPASGEAWLERLGAEQSVHGGARRHPLVGDERVVLTVPGHERLRRMRDHLERLAGATPTADSARSGVPGSRHDG